MNLGQMRKGKSRQILLAIYDFRFLRKRLLNNMKVLSIRDSHLIRLLVEHSYDFNFKKIQS